jgi:hypothetical protein
LGVVGEIKTPQDKYESGRVRLVIPDGISLNSLTPTITLSPDATDISPASGIPQNFSNIGSPYQVHAPSPSKRNYTIIVNYENDFLIKFGPIFGVSAGTEFKIYGNFGLPASDYNATLVNQSTGETTIIEGLTIDSYSSNLGIPTPLSLAPGNYKVTITRRLIQKDLPNLIKII